jgi:hypothetical protein
MPAESVITHAKWIHFSCHRSDGTTAIGTRIALSSSTKAWTSFDEGGEYDAFYDPITAQCILVLDEQVEDSDYDLWLLAVVASGFAVAALAVLLHGTTPFQGWRRNRRR